MNVTEISIAVPWGQVSGKTWGTQDRPHVLVFHGLLDNAGSFDALIPLLPSDFFYICVDLPGHGKSSHFPPHLPIYTTSYLIAYKIICTHFKQDKYVFMGHSYGGQLSVLFAQVYPKLVEKIILLDCVGLYPVSSKSYHTFLKERIEWCLRIHDSMPIETSPTYSYEEALEKNRRGGLLEVHAAENILKRALIPAGNGKYKFSFDQRLKYFINPTHDIGYAIKTLKACEFRLPILIILSSETHFIRVILQPYLNYFQSTGLVQIKYVNGNHDVHNNSPETVAPLITRFLLQIKNKL